MGPLKKQTFYTDEDQIKALKLLSGRFKKLNKPRSLGELVREGLDLVLEKYRKIK